MALVLLNIIRLLWNGLMRTNDLSHLTILPNLIFERKTGACPSGALFGHHLLVHVPRPSAIKDLQKYSANYSAFCYAKNQT